MKKLSAIFLLVCLAIFKFGHFAVEYWGAKHIDNKWSEKIYSESVESSDIEIIKIPLTLPYMPDDKEFKVVNTSYKDKGKFYRVLEQRYRQDTLEMKVVADQYKITLDALISDWLSTMESELPSDAIGNLQAKLFSQNYDISSLLTLEAPTCSVLDFKRVLGVRHFYNNPTLETLTEPPRFVLS